MQYKEAQKAEPESRGARSPFASALGRSSHHRGDGLSNILYKDGCESFAAPANSNSSRAIQKNDVSLTRQSVTGLYTADQRRRRDATPWTLVQGILAPIQFFVFLVSTVLVIRYLSTGEGLGVATASVIIKTMLLYAIMITGSIWEREVFGVYLFAPAFFWEDVFSFLVLALHTAYLVVVFANLGSPRDQMLLALAAYLTYVVNAIQFILKLRAARRDETRALPASVNDGSRA